MAGDLTTTITELLDNSDVLKSLRAEEAALAKVDARAKALGTTRGKLLKAIKQEDSARNAAVMTELRAAAAAERAASASVGFTSTVQANTDATKQLGQGLGSLSQQFADVIVSLQGGQKPMTVLTQQGLQIGDIFRTNAALAGKLSAALPVLGTAMAGVVAIGTPLLATYSALGDQTEILTGLTGQTTEALSTLADEVARIVEAQKELEQREGVLSGLISEDQVRETKAQAEATELYAGAIEQVKDNIRAYEKAIKDVEEDSESFWSLFDLSQLFGGESAEDRIRGFKTAIKGLGENVGELEEESATYAKRLETVTEGEEKASKAAKKRTKAVKAEKDEFAEMIAMEEKMAEQERRLTEERNKWLNQGIDDWVEGVEQRRQAEIKAAADAAAAWRSFTSGTQTMIGNLADFAGYAAEEIGEVNEDAAMKAFRIQQAAQVIEATISAIRIGEEFAAAAAKINPLLAFPAGAAGFAAAEAAYVMPIKQQEPPSFTDTPRTQQIQAGPSGASFKVAPGDIVNVNAARRKSDLDRQSGGNSGGNFTISIPMKVNNRTAQNIVIQAKKSKVGYTIGAPITGRRARKIGAR